MPDEADALAAALLDATAAQRAELWARSDALPAADLAWALRRACDAAWTTDPARTLLIAELVAELGTRRPDPQVQALAAWTQGIGLLAHGRMEPALVQLQLAGERFSALGQPLASAQTAVSRLAALAMLGRYDEALDCGRQARAVFDAAGDAQAAGKIELNLGTLATRRDQHARALEHYAEARRRLAAAGDLERELAALKGMADIHSRRHAFAAADALYAEARARAEAAGLPLLATMIDAELGVHAMRSGHFERALAQLERARRGYAELALPHYLAVAEEKLADAYLELNLLPEALALYERSLATYEAAGLASDRAWALSQRGRALALLGRHAAAADALAQAQAAFDAEDNPVGAALVRIWLAELALDQRAWPQAAAHALAAQAPLQAAGHASGRLHACALQAEALRGAGDAAAAQRIALEALAAAAALRLAPAQRRLQLLLGLLARDRGERAQARRCFEAAVESIESQRGTLPGEEYRAAFFGHHLRPYHELVRASLDDGGAHAAEQALHWIERGRARALGDALAADTGAAAAPEPPPRGAVAQGDTAKAAPSATTAAVQAEVDALRRRLDDSYRRLARAPAADEAADPATLLAEVQRLEGALLELGRGQQALAGATRGHRAGVGFELQALHAALGGHSALVEYFALDDALRACVVAGGRVEVVPLALPLADAQALIEQLRFQTDTLRLGSARLAHRMDELQARALHHLQRLHAALWAPLAPLLGARRAVVVPHGVLHYLPFAALHDGAGFEVERRELCRVPSAAVLLRCLQRRAPRSGRALVLGHADERLPQVRAEAQAVAACFAAPRLLLDADARAAALHEAAQAEAVHVACHAQFRHDSPRFSALHLADGAFTVLDAAQLRLAGSLVTLSACETGISAVLPGDELIGLTQAFLAAGASRVLASLWTVQDDSTAAFMAGWYRRLHRGLSPAQALRATQLELLRAQPHPYAWAAFALHGGW